MIFAVPSYTQAPCFDRGKAEPDGLTQGGSVDVRDSILITNSPVREIQSLTGDIPIRIRGIVGRQPVTDLNFPRTRSASGGAYQACTKICFARSDALVVVAARTLAASFSRVWSGLNVMRPNAPVAWTVSWLETMGPPVNMEG